MSQTISGPIAILLEAKNFAFVATLMKDGSPQITPVWIDFEKDTNTILINTAEGRVKHKNFHEILGSLSRLLIMTIHMKWLR